MDRRPFGRFPEFPNQPIIPCELSARIATIKSATITHICVFLLLGSAMKSMMRVMMSKNPCLASATIPGTPRFKCTDERVL